MLLVPGQTLDVEFGHERIGIELLDIVYAWLAPDALEEHHGANHGRHAGGVAYALHTCLEICLAVAAVVPDIVGVLFAVVADATDAATDGGLTIVVLAQFLGIGQHGLEELQRHDLDHCIARAVGPKNGLFKAKKKMVKL